MKRLLYLAYLILLMPFPLMAFDWGIVARRSPAPLSNNPPPAPSYTSKVACYCVSHDQYEPCTRNTYLLGLSDEDCITPIGPPCGHTKTLHPDILSHSAWFRIGGFLTNTDTPNVREKVLVAGRGPQDPVVLSLGYTPGQATGTYKFRSVATELPPLHSFLMPPRGLCESPSICTSDYSIRVEVSGLVELPKAFFTWAATGQPIPWLRCGKTPCAEGVDTPYNWPAHRYVHWGKPDAIADLMQFAGRWYYACSDSYIDGTTNLRVITAPKDLVVSDISLPLGGLFDVAEDWNPYVPVVPPDDFGHSAHRTGNQIDLSRNSVPVSNDRCGKRPTGNTTRDQKWKETALWKKESLLKGLRLTKTSPDPGHLKWE